MGIPILSQTGYDTDAQFYSDPMVAYPFAQTPFAHS